MRRPLVRGGARPLHRTLNKGIPPLLHRSHGLMAAGRHAEGANGPEKLAGAAEARGDRRPAKVYPEAGRARLMPEHHIEGIERLKGELLVLGGSPLNHWRTVSARRLTNELRDRALAQEAEQIATLVGRLAPGLDAPAAGLSAIRRPPSTCSLPGCGTPVRSDELDWLDDVTAGCE